MKKIALMLLVLVIAAGFACAMGSVPKNDKPKYKIEILKMDIIPATSEAKPGKVGKP